jgi:hypothetical protein
LFSSSRSSSLLLPLLLLFFSIFLFVFVFPRAAYARGHESQQISSPPSAHRAQTSSFASLSSLMEVLRGCRQQISLESCTLRAPLASASSLCSIDRATKDMTPSRKFTWEEVAQHNTPGDLYLSIHGKVAPRATIRCNFCHASSLSSAPTFHLFSRSHLLLHRCPIGVRCLQVCAVAPRRL